MSSPADSLTGTTAVGATMDPLSPPPPPPTDSPPSTPTFVSPSITTSTSLPPGTVVLPGPPLSSSSDNGLNGPILVPTDGNSHIYTTTVYSTRTSSPTSPSTPNKDSTTPNNLGVIIAGIAGGVGFLFLLVGVTWFIWIRRAKRRAGMSLINDRKFYPDRYNQTMTSNRHSRLDEVEPGPVVVQPPPDPHQISCPPPGPLSRQTSLYRDNITPSRPTRGNWVGAGQMDEILGADVPPFTRHRFPYPSTPQSLADPYTTLPEFTSTYSVNVPTAPLRFAPDPPPPPRPQHFRPSSSTHRSHHSHNSHNSHNSHRSRRSHHGHSHYQRNHAERDSYFPPIPNPVPAPVRIGRRNTVFVSPTMTPSSFSILSKPPPDPPTTRVEPITVSLASQPPAARSKFSSFDSLVVINEKKRMTVTNPDLDVDLDTDTEPDGSSKRGGSPSATDIIRLYDRDQDQDTSAASSMLREKDGRPDTNTPTMSIVAI